MAVVNLFHPGYKGGGPIKSLGNLARALGDEYEFRIVTSDRDFGDTAPYDGIAIGEWVSSVYGYILYLSKERLCREVVRSVLRETYDILYLNSFFSFSFSILPVAVALLLKRCNVPIVIAPRGEFNEGALRIKTLKKHLFLATARMFGLHTRVYWHATSAEEVDRIKSFFGEAVRVFHASNIPSRLDIFDGPVRRKESGTLDVVYVSRISRSKQLHRAIEFVGRVGPRARLIIAGPVEDEEYWRLCQSRIRQISSIVQIRYLGPVLPDEVRETLLHGHVLLLPTAGENYGHVIFESLAAGIPVIISDRTPWRNLVDSKAGWDLRFEDDDAFYRVLEACLLMDNGEYQEWTQGARALARRHSLSATEEIYRSLFKCVLSGERGEP